MDKKYIVGFVVAIVVIVGALIFINGFVNNPNPNGDLAAFAQCLKTKGIIFYGAWWCPHCHNTKAMFGSAAADLPYVECSNPAGTAQNQTCDDAGVTSYPTWVFPDGSRLVGEQTLQALADKSGCVLPAQDQTGSSAVSAVPTTTGSSSAATVVASSSAQ
jgi:hypothetical protein